MKLPTTLFFERFGSEYGITVPAIFSDEPRHIPISQMREESNAQGVCYWTYNLEKIFKEEYGYDIVERLPKLFWDEEGVYSYERYDFFNLTTKLTQQSFFEQIHNSTKNQGIMFCGHLMLEDELLGQLQWGGDIMRFYPYFDIPGIDILYDKIEFMTAKQVQSVVRQYGKEAMLSELYGVTGWDFDFKCLKMQGDWQAALGVSVRVPHLSMYSMKGCAKRDYPASFNYQAPWFREFKYLEDHYARINQVFCRCKEIVDVAVIHPIETVMLIASTKEKSGDDIDNLEKSTKAMIETLLYGNMDFDFINEANLITQKTDITSKFAVGEMEYSAVVVPPVKTIRKNTVLLLERFADNGGRVIFTGECPKYIDGRISGEAKKLYEKSLVIRDFNELLRCLWDLRRVKITAEGTENKKIYRLGRDHQDLWLFVAGAEIMGKTSKERSDTKPEKTVIEVRGEFGAEIYNTLTGDVAKADYVVRDGKTIIYRDWYVNDSLLVRLTKQRTDRKDVNSALQSSNTLIINNAQYKRHEENVAVLDICSVSLDGIAFNDRKYVFLQNKIICDRLGITPTEAQPYVVKNPKQALVYARFEFQCEEIIDGISLALERAESTKILFNGDEIKTNPDSYFIDRDIKKLHLGSTVKGNNVLEIQIPVSEIYQLEPCYISGEFCVEVKGSLIVLKPNKDDKINFTPLCNQGMPFYSGNISYKSKFYSEECVAEIVVENFAAPCIKVLIDGNDAGLIAFSPFSVKTRLSQGEHQIELICYGNRNNTFGPIHNKRINDPYYYITPSSWDYEEGNFSENYVFQETGILESPIIRFYIQEDM